MERTGVLVRNFEKNPKTLFVGGAWIFFTPKKYEF